MSENLDRVPGDVNEAWTTRRVLRAQVSAIRVIHGECERLDSAVERLARFEDMSSFIIRSSDGTF